MSFNRILSLITEIEQLKEENSSTNAQLEVWRNMVAWQFWLASLPDKDTWRVYFNELPLSHPIRELAGKLTWLEVQLSPVLTARRDGFWSERVYIALDLLFTDMLDSGYSQDEISSLEAMNEGIAIVNTLLDNDELWEEFREGKRQENEQWELRQKYRRMANFGELSEEAEEWLRENDSAFLENFISKKESTPEVKPITTEAIAPALPETLPEVVKPKSDNYVLAHWAGLDENWLMQTADGTLPIFRNREYRLTTDVWLNIQGDFYLRQRWHKVG